MTAELEPAESERAGGCSANRVLLVGNPNTGKTSLFNVLAGVHAKTANYPGITVDYRQADIHVPLSDQQEQPIVLVDLPGMYSLDPASDDDEGCSNPQAETRHPGSHHRSR